MNETRHPRKKLSIMIKVLAVIFASVLLVPLIILAFAPSAERLSLGEIPWRQWSHRNILIAYAHMDDEIVPAGLIAALAQKGNRLTIWIATDGSANPTTDLSVCPSRSAVTCRARELRDSASYLGIRDIVNPALPDSRLSDFIEPARASLLALHTDQKFDLVLTTEPSGFNGNADHVAAFKAVFQTFTGLPSELRPDLLLSTAPMPWRWAMPSKMPEGFTDLKHFPTASSPIKKARMWDIYASQRPTLDSMSLFMTPQVLFWWLQHEVYWWIPKDRIGELAGELNNQNLAR